MKQILQTKTHAFPLACALGLLFAAAACENEKPEPAKPDSTAVQERSGGGLVAGGAVSTSGRYVLISTTSPVAAQLDTTAEAEEGSE